MRKVVMLGATRGMGRSLARLFAQRGDQLVLLGSNEEDVARSVADLSARSTQPNSIFSARCDLSQVSSFAPALEEAKRLMGDVDTVVVTAAVFASQDALENDPTLNERMLTVNFTNTVLFCEEARKLLLARGGGSLCVFGSVAGDRARKPTLLYGASKAGLSAYLEGLDHKFRSAGLHTICVKPGFVHTSMTQGLKAPPFAGQPDQVAEIVLHAIEDKKPVVYAPGMWKWVMLVIRWLPRFVMRKIGF